MPDIVPNIRWLDDEIGSFFTAFASHRIDRQAIAGNSVGGSTLPGGFGLNGSAAGGNSCIGQGEVAPGILTGSCTNGQVMHAMGWGNLYALHLNLPKTPGYAPFARDYILTEVTFSNGARQEGGFHPSKHVRGGSPPFTEGGLLTDEGRGCYRPSRRRLHAGKGNVRSLELRMQALLDIVYGPRLVLEFPCQFFLGWTRPGPIARNTDWTNGGVGNYFGQAYEFGLHYGV
jgi:hypothetical protein